MRPLLSVLLLSAACGVGTFEGVEDEGDNGLDDTASVAQGLVSCAESQSTGYRNGNAFPVTLITIDGELVEKTTGNAYAVMQAAAAAEGVYMRINSGFRTPQEQQYLYNCYVNCNCNNCSLAAPVGYSNHQSGTALDLNTANGAVYNWLNAHGGAFGFQRTVPSEAWHWEYFSGGPGGGPCTSPPPPCDRSWGPFTFSCDGAEAGMECVNVNEPSDPDTWNDNFFCSKGDFGLAWSYARPISGMTCTNVSESAEWNPTAWSDNYLCTPAEQSPWKLSWSSAGAIAGRSCIHWNETADPESWSDNYLCIEPVLEFSNAAYTFSVAGPSSGTCVNVDEPSDPDTWTDNYFCSPTDVGMRWSYAGPIDGMACTNVGESADAHAAEWADNYLCVPQTAPVRFHWSSAGPLADMPCVRWFEPAETSPTWHDNWMCIELLASNEPPVATVQRPADPVVPEVGTAPATKGEIVAGGCSMSPSLMPLLAGLLLGWRRRGRARR